MVDSLGAYALARLNLPGKRFVFFLIVATLMVPGQILLVPVYLILNSFGWLDTSLGRHCSRPERELSVFFSFTSFS